MIIVIRQFIRDLKREKTRLFLTIFAIAWGTASIAVMLAIGEGVTGTLKKGMSGMGRGIMIVWSGQTSKVYEGLGVGRQIRLVEEDVKLVEEQAQEIELVSPEFVRWGVYFVAGNRSLTVRVVGAYPSYGEMRNLIPGEGRFINEFDLKFRRRVVFLGNDIAEKLFSEGDKVGRTIYVNGIPFTVIGIMKEKVQTSCYQGMDEAITVIPASTFSAIFGHRYLNDMVCRPRDPSRSEQAKKRLYEVMGGKYRFDPEDEEALSIWDTVEMEEIFDRVSMGVQIFLGIIGGLTLIVAGVGVANIMYVVVRDRTREIGIKMAVGAKERQIIYQYMLEALLTVFLGGVIGLFLSWGFVKLVNLIPVDSEMMKYVGRPTMSLSVVLISATVLGTIGFVSGILPAKKAASVNPAEALRYE